MRANTVGLTIVERVGFILRCVNASGISRPGAAPPASADAQVKGARRGTSRPSAVSEAFELEAALAWRRAWNSITHLSTEAGSISLRADPPFDD
jgi:hypothetical protein